MRHPWILDGEGVPSKIPPTINARPSAATSVAVLLYMRSKKRSPRSEPGSRMTQGERSYGGGLERYRGPLRTHLTPVARLTATDSVASSLVRRRIVVWIGRIKARPQGFGVQGWRGSGRCTHDLKYLLIDFPAVAGGQDHNGAGVVHLSDPGWIDRQPPCRFPILHCRSRQPVTSDR